MTTIVPGTPHDIHTIMELYALARAYQKDNGYERWPVFSEEATLKEVRDGRNFKIVSGGEVACVFSVQYNDPVIWLERDADAAVYLHRIAVNPAFKGQKMMCRIREWAIDHARAYKKRYVRMDTWGCNEKIRTYYMQCGFPYIGQQQLPDNGAGPAHYGGSLLSLFEIPVT